MAERLAVRLPASLIAEREGAVAILRLNRPQKRNALSHAMLSSLNGTAHSIDFTAYPAPVPWYGDNVRGLIMGMRG